MIIVNYDYQNQSLLGILHHSNQVTTIENIYSELGLNVVPNDMNALIEHFNDIDPNQIEKILEKGSLPYTALDDIKLKTPIPFPRRNIFCLGKNYADHAEEVKSKKSTDSAVPSNPIYFTKLAYPCIGNGDTILRHENATQKMDYEVELAIIIGKKGINISSEDAESHIFGYTIANDVSSRDLQKRHHNWFKGKSLDTHCSIGPWIVHKSKIPFPVELDIRCWVNDELRQNSNTSQLIFDIPYIISDLSKGLTLVPGDIILTGTPAGVGLGFEPPKYLNPGDTIKCEIDKIGTLINPIES